MQLIAARSGGRILFPQSMQDVVEMYGEIGRALGTAYSLGYISPAAASDKRARRIEVRVRDGRMKTTQSRREYTLR
jgi:hypothetical protein